MYTKIKHISTSSDAFRNTTRRLTNGVPYPSSFPLLPCTSKQKKIKFYRTKLLTPLRCFVKLDPLPRNLFYKENFFYLICNIMFLESLVR